ncbi:hypothetical protein [Streptomyces sp. NPDC002889]|uniref:hypothetical protein n=1 Tax=Streptomyces sp. NPDC002889 TaxID=3364669 RepID=UPI00369EAF10
MSDDSREEMLDQLVFRWEGNRDRHDTGITAVDYSCDDERAQALRARLAPLLRVEGGRKKSLVRVVLEETGEVVVIRRRPDPDALGRQSTLSHALVGSPTALHPQVCLTLNSWTWAERDLAEQASGGMPRVRVGQVNEVARDQWASFAGFVSRVEKALTAVVAQVLRRPRSRVSVRISEISETGHYAPLLIWGLCGVFGDWLGDDYWTFATYDTVDSNGLRMVCMPQWRQSATQDTHLERIALKDPLQDEAHQVATELVRLFLSVPDQPTELRRLLRRCPEGPELPQEERLARLGDLVAPRRAQTQYRPLTAASPMAGPQEARTEERRSPGAAAPLPHGEGVYICDQGPLGEQTHNDEHTGFQEQLRPEKWDRPGEQEPSSTDSTPAVTYRSAALSYEESDLLHAPQTPADPAEQVTSAPDRHPVLEPLAHEHHGHEVSLHKPPREPASAGPQADHHSAQADRAWHAPAWRPGYAAPGAAEDGSSGQPLPPGSGEVPVAEKPAMPRPGTPLTGPTPSQTGPAVMRQESGPQVRHRTDDERAATIAASEDSGRAAPRGLVRMSDTELLDRLRPQDLARPSVVSLLVELEARVPRRSPQEAETVCREVLDQRLYLYHHLPGADADDPEQDRQAAETAVRLFRWAVLPYAGRPGHADALDRLIRTLCANGGPAERDVLERAVPDLIRHLLQRSASPLPGLHDRFLSRLRRSPGARQGPQHGAHSAMSPDDRWKAGFIGMALVAVLLFLFLVAAWG